MPNAARIETLLALTLACRFAALLADSLTRPARAEQFRRLERNARRRLGRLLKVNADAIVEVDRPRRAAQRKGKGAT